MQTSADIVLSPPDAISAAGGADSVALNVSRRASRNRPRLRQPCEAANHRPAAHNRSRDHDHRGSWHSIVSSDVLGGAWGRARLRRLGGDQLLVRQGYRPGDGSDLQPATSLRAHRAVAGADVRCLVDHRFSVGVHGGGEHPGRGPGSRRSVVLRLHLHHAAEAPNSAQHRHRGSRRRVSAAGRLGRRPGEHRMAGVRAVRCGVPLDPTSFLVAGAPAASRLQECERANAPGDHRHRPDPPAHPAVPGGPDREQACSRGSCSALGYTAGAAVLGGGYLALALWARAKATSGAAALLFHYSLAYLALIFVVGAVAAVVLG